MVKDKHKITLENRRILVIDDNLKIHEDFRKILAPAAVCGELGQLGASLFDEGPQANDNEVFEVGFADQGQADLEGRSQYPGCDLHGILRPSVA